MRKNISRRRRLGPDSNRYINCPWKTSALYYRFSNSDRVFCFIGQFVDVLYNDWNQPFADYYRIGSGWYYCCPHCNSSQEETSTKANDDLCWHPIIDQINLSLITHHTYFVTLFEMLFSTIFASELWRYSKENLS